MKRKPNRSKSKSSVDWVEAARRVRAKCNRLSDEEREKLLEDGLQMIYGAHAKTNAGGR